MFELQKGFQQKYKERFKFTKFLASIALLVESFELMLKTPFKGDKNYKWWSKKPVPSHEERVEELVDVWHFFMNYMIKEKIEPEELFKVYLAKLKVNYERQESGTY
jgi:dimeric dUTPase (all-alpha-NTP-PPase superfamily)